MPAEKGSTSRTAERKAVNDVLRRGRNYRELRRDHNFRRLKGEFHDLPTGQAAVQQIWLAVETWRRRWRARARVQGRETHLLPAQGPWSSECSGDDRMEITRTSRYLRACLELAWARENRWDARAARRRVQETATRLPTMQAVNEAKNRRARRATAPAPAGPNKGTGALDDPESPPPAG